MSGLSLAVAPRTDPDAEPSTLDVSLEPTIDSQQPQSVAGGVMGSLRVIELQLVAFILVFSASSLVPVLDLAFPVLSSLYLLLLSRLAFPAFSSSPPSSSGQEIFQGSRLFRAYVVVGTTIGLFLPLAYVLGGFARGDDHAVRSATPHLFLLSGQILTENVVSGLGVWSPPVRAMVPLIYTVTRLFVVVDWIYDVWFNKTPPATSLIKEAAWVWFGRVLALANLAYFSISLFGFLIPRYLPQAFERYFHERDEVHLKMADDKPAGVPVLKAKSEVTKKLD